MPDSETRALLAWYDRHRRDLPWRRTRDPYRVWLSEVMLQQTRVETVLAYYERFLGRFPTVEHLARADEEEVLAQWSGLGYYRRARQLHRAAREISRRGGRFPEDPEGLRELPGIGPYTAAAVASIAFRVAEPVLDGNVERVASRLLASVENPKSSRGRRRLRERLMELLDPRRPGDSNQALMELGATVCTPRTPRCGSCPLSAGCRAREQGEPEGYPVPRRRRRTERLRRAVVVVEDGPALGRAGEPAVLLFRRADDAALLPGTWELPWVELSVGGEPVDGEPASRKTADRITRGLAKRYGGGWRLGARLGRVRHGITYRSIEVEIYRGHREATDNGGEPEWPEGSAERVAAGFFDAASRRGLPRSSLVNKVLEEVEADSPETGRRGAG